VLVQGRLYLRKGEGEGEGPPFPTAPLNSNPSASSSPLIAMGEARKTANLPEHVAAGELIVDARWNRQPARKQFNSAAKSQ
jgi:hypothetical protein